jgi:hypothetical protein
MAKRAAGMESADTAEGAPAVTSPPPTVFQDDRLCAAFERRSRFKEWVVNYMAEYGPAGNANGLTAATGGYTQTI